MHIPEYINAIASGNDADAVRIIYDNNPLPEMCGKVCTRRCEFACVMDHLGDSVAIRWLKRFATEQFESFKGIIEAKPEPLNGKKVAIIGAGPAGLTAGYYLRLKGYDIDIFEALPKAGGMTYAGIPKYRFPIPSLDKQVELIESVGVRIHTNTPVSKDKFKELQKEYDAIFVATGLPGGMGLRVDGDDHPKVIYAIDFLRTINLGGTMDIGKDVVVVGGGNTAIDAVRVAKRLGANSFIAYR